MVRIVKNKIASAGCLILVGLVAVLHGDAAGRSQSQQERPRFLVDIREGTIDTSPQGASTHSCILVQPDGRLRLERKIQHLPRTTATANVFTYYLDSSQLQQLQAILESEEVGRLPAYAQPTLPLGVPWSYGFNAKIADGEGVHSVGYWKWRGGSPTVSPNSAPESLKEEWRASEAALHPLEEWVRGIEGLKLTPSDEKSTMCAGDEN